MNIGTRLDRPTPFEKGVLLLFPPKAGAEAAGTEAAASAGEGASVARAPAHASAKASAATTRRSGVDEVEAAPGPLIACCTYPSPDPPG